MWSQRDWNQANRGEDGNPFHLYLELVGRSSDAII